MNVGVLEDAGGTVFVTVGEFVSVNVTVWVPDTVGEWVFVIVCVRVGVDVCVAVAVGETVAECVEVPETVNVRVAVLVAHDVQLRDSVAGHVMVGLGTMPQQIVRSTQST